MAAWLNCLKSFFKTIHLHLIISKTFLRVQRRGSPRPPSYLLFWEKNKVFFVIETKIFTVICYLKAKANCYCYSKNWTLFWTFFTILCFQKNTFVFRYSLSWEKFPSSHVRCKTKSHPPGTKLVFLPKRYKTYFWLPCHASMKPHFCIPRHDASPVLWAQNHVFWKGGSSV